MSSYVNVTPHFNYAAWWYDPLLGWIQGGLAGGVAIIPMLEDTSSHRIDAMDMAWLLAQNLKSVKLTFYSPITVTGLSPYISFYSPTTGWTYVYDPNVPVGGYTLASGVPLNIIMDMSTHIPPPDASQYHAGVNTLGYTTTMSMSISLLGASLFWIDFNKSTETDF